MDTIEFRIEATRPTKQSDLKAVLVAQRDAWIRTTPQLTDKHAATCAEMVVSARQDQAESKNPTSAHAKLASAIDALNKTVEANSSTLDEHHAAAVSLMDAGIASAVLQAGAAAYAGRAVRASVVGHRDEADDGIHPRPGIRLLVAVELAG
jgi:hypothetical protein